MNRRPVVLFRDTVLVIFDFSRCNVGLAALAEVGGEGGAARGLENAT